MFSGPRNHFRPLHAQRIQILEERVHILRRVLANGYARLRRVAYDLVVHVRDVHNVAQLHTRQLQKTPQHIHLQKRAEVTDVPVVVDRRPARVHAQRLAICRKNFV